MRKLLLGLGFAFLIGLTLLYFGSQYFLRVKNERDEAVRNQKKRDIAITLIEGLRREEIAAKLDKAGICTYSSFIAASQGYEGTLFPDTYRFFPNTIATEVVRKMLANFSLKTADLGLTKDQVILASIVEREAENNEERPIIAGVYSNRLKIEMKMEADPTVQYARDNQAYTKSSLSPSFSFWGPITQADYHAVISPYNTYLNLGLPPGPIANPGLESLKAAQNPSQHDYFFFLHKDKQLLLSKTLAEHLSKQN